MTYDLNADPQELRQWLEPEQHVTTFDADDDYAARRYVDGLALSHRFRRIVIKDWSGQWSAEGDDVHPNSTLMSYECIGYHRSTDALLRGFIDGPAAIVVVLPSGEHVTVKPERDAVETCEVCGDTLDRCPTAQA